MASYLAGILLNMIEKDMSGIYNLAGSTHLNRYELALKIAEKFSLDKNLIAGVTSEELNQKAKRPKMGGLKLGKIGKELMIKVKGLDYFLDELKMRKNTFEDAS